MVKLIIFDSWGTVIETGLKTSPSKQVKNILRLNIEFSEFIEHFEEVFMTKHYDNLTQAFSTVADSFNKRLPDFVIDKLVGLWNKNAILAHPYPETIEALQALKGKYKLALLSNTDQFAISQVFDKNDMKELFDIIHFSCDTGLLKSHSESFHNLIAEAGVKPEEALMVGDSLESDIKGAKNAGIPAVLIDRRAWYEGDEPKITSLLELDAYIESLK